MVQSVCQPMLPIEDIYLHAVAPPGSPKAVPLWYAGLFAHASLFLLRCQYYSVWRLAEGSAIAAGFGYRQPAALASTKAGAGAALGPAEPDSIGKRTSARRRSSATAAEVEAAATA